MEKKYLTCLIVLTGIIACNNEKPDNNTTKDSAMTTNTSTANADRGGAISLFDGKTFSGWHGFNKTGEVKNWAIEDGAMVCLGAAPDAHGGDIASDRDYENFELSWEWKVTKGGNSGVMYHVVEDAKYQAPYETGPEYQMIDDTGFPQKLEDWQKTGADYAMYTPGNNKKVNPTGEWNTSRIIFNKGHVEHWLNGEKIVEFESWSDDWKKRRAEGKWKDYPAYGNAKTGKIALQDHGNKVYFRNIMIREL
jgi:hypothetical protein